MLLVGVSCGDFPVTRAIILSRCMAARGSEVSRPTPFLIRGVRPTTTNRRLLIPIHCGPVVRVVSMVTTIYNNLVVLISDGGEAVSEKKGAKRFGVRRACGIIAATFGLGAVALPRISPERAN